MTTTIREHKFLQSWMKVLGQFYSPNAFNFNTRQKNVSARLTMYLLSSSPTPRTVLKALLTHNFFDRPTLNRISTAFPNITRESHRTAEMLLLSQGHLSRIIDIFFLILNSPAQKGITWVHKHGTAWEGCKGKPDNYISKRNSAV